MAKYNKTIVKRICDLIESDSYTIAEICKIVEITEDTYHRWKKEKPEFSECIKKAQDKWDDSIVADAKRSLKKLINGYSIEETKVIYTDSGKPDKDGKQIPKIKEQVKITKHFQPSLGAAIFALTNKASDEWKNRQNNEIDAKVNVQKITPEEAAKFAKEMKKDYDNQ